MNFRLLPVLLVAMLSMAASSAFADDAATKSDNKKSKKGFLFFKKKSKDETPAPVSPYKTMTGRDSLAMSGVMNVIQKEDTVYLELPTRLLGKQFLVSNKLQQVPIELNESSVNKGINYANQVVRFEWDKKGKAVKIYQQRLTPEVPEGSRLARSVADNYIAPIIASR